MKKVIIYLQILIRYIFVFENKMGQSKLIKISQSNSKQIVCIQHAPLVLITLGAIMASEKLIVNSSNHKEINIGGTDCSFKIVADREIEDVKQFIGFVEIFNKNGVKVFQGTVKKFKRQGFGIQYDQNSKIFYRGQFQNNVYHGWGQTQRYKGQFKNGLKDGWGIWRDLSNNIFYQGLFKQDLFNGIGYFNIDHNEIESFLKQETTLQMKSKYPKKYIGFWQNGYMHGRGKLITCHQIYKGSFQKGILSGDGQLTSENITYQGTFYNNNYINK